MNKIYYIILSWNYKDQQDQQNFDLAPARYRSKTAAAFAAADTLNTELALFAKVNEVDKSSCRMEKHPTRNLWTLSTSDKSKPYSFKAEVVECIL